MAMPVWPRGKQFAVTVSMACLAVTGFGVPAQAIDCAKAASQVEKAICANDVLLRADNALSQAYKAVSARLASENRQSLRQTQRQWIKRRGWCENTGQPIAECILRETIDRTLQLSGRPHAGPGTGARISPQFVAQLGSPSLRSS